MAIKKKILSPDNILIAISFLEQFFMNDNVENFFGIEVANTPLIIASPVENIPVNIDAHQGQWYCSFDLWKLQLESSPNQGQSQPHWNNNPHNGVMTINDISRVINADNFFSGDEIIFSICNLTIWITVK